MIISAQESYENARHCWERNVSHPNRASTMATGKGKGSLLRLGGQRDKINLATEKAPVILTTGLKQ